MPSITLTLTPALIAEIMRLVDLQPLVPAAPRAFWELQTTIEKALQANPDALRAVSDERARS